MSVNYYAFLSILQELEYFFDPCLIYLYIYPLKIFAYNNIYTIIYKWAI